MTGFGDGDGSSGSGKRAELPVAAPELVDRLLSPGAVDGLDRHQLTLLGVEVDA